MELGYLHNIVQKYTENNINNKNGVVASGIGFCLYEELSVYYETINTLQKEVYIYIYHHNNSKIYFYVYLKYFYFILLC